MNKAEAFKLANGFRVDWTQESGKIRSKVFFAARKAASFAKHMAKKHGNSSTIAPLKDGVEFGGAVWIMPNTIGTLTTEWNPI